MLGRPVVIVREVFSSKVDKSKRLLGCDGGEDGRAESLACFLMDGLGGLLGRGYVV